MEAVQYCRDKGSRYYDSANVQTFFRPSFGLHSDQLNSKFPVLSKADMVKGLPGKIERLRNDNRTSTQPTCKEINL